MKFHHIGIAVNDIKLVLKKIETYFEIEDI